MAKPGKEQGRFIITSDSRFEVKKPPKKIPVPEGISWLPRVSTYTDTTSPLFEENGQLEYELANARMEIGSRVDDFASLAQSVYGNREVFCNELFDDRVVWSLFRLLMPTTESFYYKMPILLNNRDKFLSRENGRNPYEKGAIKKELHFVWEELVSKFRLDHLRPQSTMVNANGVLLPSGRTATSEDIARIAQDIIENKFDTLVKDEPDRDYFSQVDLYIAQEINGELYFVHYRPDVIKRLKDQQGTTQARVASAQKKGQVIVNRIVEEMKDSKRKAFEDPTTPQGRLIRYNAYFMDIAARKFDPTQLKTRIRPFGRSVKDYRGYIITPDMPDIFSREEIETEYIFMDEEGDEMFMQIPKLSDRERERIAEEINGVLLKAA